MEEIINKVKDACNKRGTIGVAKLAKAFKIFDDDGKRKLPIESRTLSIAEFKKGMDNYDTGLNEEQVKQLFEYADKDKSGTMNYEEFLNILRDPLSPECRDVVLKVFAKMDQTGDGVIKTEDMRKFFKNESGDFEAYLERFDSGDGGSGPIEVTQEEFLEYYTKQRFSNYRDDKHFIDLLKGSWLE